MRVAARKRTLRINREMMGMVEGKDDKAAEPFELMQYFYRRSHDPLIRCRIDLPAHIDVSLFKRALKVSATVAPLVFCVFDEDRGAWVKQECGADDAVSLVSANLTNEHLANEQLASGDHVSEDDSPSLESALLQSLDHHAGPRLRVSVMRGGKGDTLCIIVDHMICDGAGFRDYLYLLAEIYSAMESGSDGRSLVDGYPARRDFGQVSDNIGLMRKLSIVLAGTSAPSENPEMRLPLQGDAKDARLARVVIKQADFVRICAYAKSHKVTVNDLLLTAYARTLRNRTGCSDIVLPCPVDLRRYGKAGQRFGFCNLTSNYFCHLEMRRGESFDEVLIAVAAQMKAQKESDACLKGPLLLHALARVVSRRRLEDAFFKAAGVPVVSFTNLGVIDEARLAFGAIKPENAFFATALKRPPSFQLSVSTFQDACTMTSSLYVNEDDFKRVKSFLEEVKGELVAACGK